MCYSPPHATPYHASIPPCPPQPILSGFFSMPYSPPQTIPLLYLAPLVCSDSSSVHIIVCFKEQQPQSFLGMKKHTLPKKKDYPAVDNRNKYFLTWSGSHTNEQQARRGRLSMEQLIWELVQLFKLVEEQWIIHWNQSRPFDKGYHHLIHLNQRRPFNKTKSSNGRISNPAQNSLSIP